MESKEHLIKTLKKDLIRVSMPDCEKIADLVLQVKGPNMTLKEFAGATGISAPTLSRITNGKINKPLSMENIVNIVASSDTPSLEAVYSLAIANGYMSKSKEASFREKIKLSEIRNNLHASVKTIMHLLIVAELFQRISNTKYQIVERENGILNTIIKNEIPYDFSLDVKLEKENYKWMFIFFPQKVIDYKLMKNITAEYLTNTILQNMSSLFLTDAWFPIQYKNTKISFVFVDPDVYKEFTMLADNTKLNNVFSAILLDDDDNIFIDEKCFHSSYNIDSIFSLPKKIALDFSNSPIDDIGKDILMQNEDLL